MSDEQLLIRAICAHPAEDTPRLAYADWLDEHAADGRGARSGGDAGPRGSAGAWRETPGAV